MRLYQIVVLAIVQGVFAFLPISSWTHLIMVPAVLGWAYDSGLPVDIAVHVGALMAVMLYFRREMWRLGRGGLLLLRGRLTGDGRFLLLLILATLPLIGASFLVQGYGEAMRQNFLAVALATIGFGLLLYTVDATFMQIRRLEHLGTVNALIFGLAQVIALLPGTSRTGITMTASRFLGFERLEAARFALLLSVPAGFGRLGLLAREAMRSEAPALEAPALLAGFLAFVSALLAIWFLMTWLKRANAGIFAIYRVLAGAGILYWYYVMRPV